jgi:hypothetical protein
MWIDIQMLMVIDMGKMNIVLSDELEEKFRRTVFERKGMKKGNISDALSEAIEHWIEHYEGKREDEQSRKR